MKLDAKQAAALRWTSAKIRTIVVAEPAEKEPAVAKSAAAEGPQSLSVFFRDFKWANVEALRIETQKGVNPEELDIAYGDTAASAVLPGLMQVLAVQAPLYRLELVRQLRTLPSGDDAATRALVRLALFDNNADVRSEAVKALGREPRDKVGRLLLAAFRYPWHIVAERSALAIVALDRTDLLPALVDLLDEREPTEPIAIQDGDKKVLGVREIVKVNHNRNCLVCHAPVAPGSPPVTDELLAQVPSPDEVLPPLSSPYRSGIGPAIRATEIHLRQDFSIVQKVKNPGDWPDLQRFDYLVRIRTVTVGEARARNQPRLERAKREASVAASSCRAVRADPAHVGLRRHGLGRVAAGSRTLSGDESELGPLTPTFLR